MKKSRAKQLKLSLTNKNVYRKQRSRFETTLELLNFILEDKIFFYYPIGKPNPKQDILYNQAAVTLRMVKGGIKYYF